MPEVRFSGVVEKVLFKRGKDGQETQILFTGVDLGVESRDKLLNLQETGDPVEVLLDVVPPNQMGFGFGQDGAGAEGGETGNGEAAE